MEISTVLYNGNGQTEDESKFKVPFSDINQCFAKVFGKDVAIEDEIELVRTSAERYSGTAGYVIALHRFRYKYPKLS